MAHVVAMATLLVALGAAAPRSAAAQQAAAQQAMAQQAAAQPEAPRVVADDPLAPTDCVWPAVGGAVAGLAVGWYGFVGLYAIGGGSAFELEPTAGNVSAILALEWLGMVGGATAACAIWGDEGRWLPTAGPVITGGMLGGGAGASLAYLVIEAADIDANTDNPVASVLIALTATTLGVLGGGWAGFEVDRALRGPPGGTLSVTPTASPDALGLVLAYAP